VADGVHAAVNAVKPTAPSAGLDRALAQPGGPKLRHSDDSMLPVSQLRQGQITTKSISHMDFMDHVHEDPADPAPHPSSMTVSSAPRRGHVTNSARSARPRITSAASAMTPISRRTMATTIERCSAPARPCMSCADSKPRA
jgi:hypothetical protein